MAGTLVHDAAQSKLHDAVDIASATTTTGAGVLVNKPGPVRFKLTNGAVTGADTIATVEIQSCDVEDFSTGSPTIISHGKFDTIDVNSDSVTRFLDARVYRKYVRAVTVTTGSAVSVADLTVTVEEPHFQRQASDTA